MTTPNLSDDIFNMGLAMNRAQLATIEATTRFPSAPIRKPELTREELCDLAEMALRTALHWRNLKEQDARTADEHTRWTSLSLSLSLKLSAMAREAK